jgi:hypothetical protein
MEYAVMLIGHAAIAMISYQKMPEKGYFRASPIIAEMARIPEQNRPGPPTSREGAFLGRV